MNYNERSVPQLKDEIAKRGIQVSSKAKKSDLVAALEAADTSNAAAATTAAPSSSDAASHQAPDSPPAHPLGSKRVAIEDAVLSPAPVKKEKIGLDEGQRHANMEVKLEPLQQADVKPSALKQLAAVKAETPALTVKHEEHGAPVDDSWDHFTTVIPRDALPNLHYCNILTQDQQRSDAQLTCPYMDSINRHILDFDFEKLCSVSNVKLNVYACLVCGKLFSGRSKTTPAYTHSLDSSHHVFMKLTDGDGRTTHELRTYCLPDNYEVLDASVNDIRAVLRPKYSPEDVKVMDTKMLYSRGLDGTEFVPGTIGLNNLRATDYMNVVIQALALVSPLRDFFLTDERHEAYATPLALHFGRLLKRMWNPRNFKGQVSPHEVLQVVSVASERRFSFLKQSDPVDFLAWFLGNLHMGLGGSKASDSSIVFRTFRGGIKLITRRIKVPFSLLTLDLPPAPLFKDEQEKNIIPQVPLVTLLRKFDGVTEKEEISGDAKRYILTSLPPYIIMHVKRFVRDTQNRCEKNPTIVNFPIKNLDMRDFCTPEAASAVPSTRYDLVANVCHEGSWDHGIYKVHVLHAANQQWYEVQDLHIQEVLPQMVAISEAYIQVFKRQQ